MRSVLRRFHHLDARSCHELAQISAEFEMPMATIVDTCRGAHPTRIAIQPVPARRGTEGILSARANLMYC